MKNAELGSVIHGTMRKEDLIPCFVELLHNLGERDGELDEISYRMIRPRYFESRCAFYDLEDLFDALDEFSPEGAYFGAHPGDGSDFGFWMYAKENG